MRNTHRFARRHGLIACTTNKFANSDFWNARGSAEIEIAGSLKIKRLAGSVDKFKTEDAAQNELIRIGKRWIDQQINR